MRGQPVAAVLAGAVTGGLGTALVVRPPDVRAQGKDRAADRRGGWEYRVVLPASARG